MKFLDDMFGFIIRQPIHQTLRQMRLVSVYLIISSQMLLWYIVDQLYKLDPSQAAMAYATIAATLIAAIWKGVDSLHKPNDKDPE
jgi:MFS superfamily sulfate permease-like transporter